MKADLFSFASLTSQRVSSQRGALSRKHDASHPHDFRRDFAIIGARRPIGGIPTRGSDMSNSHFAVLAGAAALAAATFAGPTFAQQPQQPPFATTKVEGTDGVYIFRNGGAQSMFIVTPEGVIATDPIGYARPEGVQDYINEIKKVTNQPIKYLVYSHHHFDHISGGKPFKDAGARIIAHKQAKVRLEQTKNPLVVPIDETFDTTKTIELGGTKLELSYIGLNHSDSNIVMRLPREKIVFIVDTIPVGQVPGRGFIDMYPLEAEDFIKGVIAMDWDRLIPGHPGVNGRLGTKQDARDQLRLLEEASAEMKPLGIAGKCWAAEKDLKLSNFKEWPGYEQGLEFIGRRYCGVWGRGT
jgi:glyoxylase-like metal-dependent hydrolase (beta-lactamase superfamily II)